MDTSSFGAIVDEQATTFRVWAPEAGAVTVLREGEPPVPMEAVGEGVFETRADAPPGTRYRLDVDGTLQIPDPASRFQPDGVHGPSMVVDPDAYDWQDADWTGLDRSDLVIYELHIGTFTPEGTYDAVRRHLPYLKDLGVTAIELMPVHDFPGDRNWGYDPAALFAPSRAYGTPDALRRLVDAAHRCGLAVILDVIYNHLGPDGAYVNAIAPFLTDTYETPWGPAINLDDDGSAGVRRFFLQNALHWLTEYHVDGLRLDATHALHDASDTHFLTELSAAVEARVSGPKRHLIAEDHRNLNTLVQPRAEGGHGLDAQWSDDLHHQVRNRTAGDRESYFADFEGTTTADLATTLRDGWFFQGQHADYFGGPRGTDPVDPDRCVVFIQNHDQVGNRPVGDRLTESVSPSVYRALSALICSVPEVPLLFMGQEWGAETPFQFFTDHNEELGPLVTEGRKEEFEGFSGFDGDVPDPQDSATFDRSILDWDEPTRPVHDGLLRLYREWLTLRPQLGDPERIHAPNDAALVLERPPYTLVVCLDDAGTTVGGIAGREVVLDTESHAPNPEPATLTDGTLTFARAGAVAVR